MVSYEHIFSSRYRIHDEFNCNNFTWFDLTNVITTVKTFAIQTIKKKEHEILVTKEMPQSFKFQALHLSHSCSNLIYCLLCWLNIYIFCFLMSCITITLEFCFLHRFFVVVVTFILSWISRQITWRCFKTCHRNTTKTQPSSKQFINSNSILIPFYDSTLKPYKCQSLRPF